jgi:hypothetical protein
MIFCQNPPDARIIYGQKWKSIIYAGEIYLSLIPRTQLKRLSGGNTKKVIQQSKKYAERSAASILHTMGIDS